MVFGGMKIIKKLCSLILMSVVCLHSAPRQPILIDTPALISGGLVTTTPTIINKNTQLNWIPAMPQIVMNAIDSIFARTTPN